ncbi:DNA internalization-related competence protein ComEC/Rec2 [Thalassotalea sp. M1531]|uniref:DNA internalization-related competence protein ComEC/Rec2 n=1 Tax=Thalassotalea algicola TaxID=2716224 RepID=A0A7Y0Q7H1_9GAMM|nr:DNA internalization-related competence protein ComEC/Rec2 [Thalassotalea algicola]NMP31040.1 DNA internalization-related competence protein ComEC/Rec2 [Thalassotalea algicola]
MDRWLLSFIVGAILSLLAPTVPALFYECSMFLILLAWIAFNQYRLFLSAVLGILWMFNHGQSYQLSWQDNQLADNSNFFYQQHHSNFTVLGIPSKTPNGWRFTAKIHAIDQQQLKRPLKVRLNWQSSKLTLENNANIKAAIKLKPANGLANLGGFSYQRWLRSQNIVATGYVVTAKKVVITEQETSLRAQFYRYIRQLLGDNNQRSLILALSFGDRSLFNKNTWTVLQKTGTQHLVAISGLHIALVVWLSFSLLFFAVKLLPLSALNKTASVLLARHNLVYIALTCALIFSSFYAYLAGFSIPTIRALIFFYIFCISQYFSLKLTPSRLIIVAVFVTLIVLPASLYSTSFWLSYLAVIAIVSLYWRLQHFIRHLKGVKKGIVGFLLIQVSLSLVLMPISAFIFQQSSIIALLANLLALPVISFIVMPLLFVSLVLSGFLPLLSSYFFSAIEFILTALWAYLELLASWSMASVQLSHHMTWLMILLAIITGLFFFFMDKSRLRLLVLSATACTGVTLLSGFAEQVKPKWTINVLDVGQGLAIAIAKGENTLLYDTGNAYPSGWNMVEQVISPFLQHQSLTLDTVIVSHDDSDHAGGLPQLLRDYPNVQLVFNAQVIEAFFGKQSPCLAGSNLQWQGLTVSMLWPIEQVADKNDDSCVVTITDGNTTVLITGDIGKKIEKQLIRMYPNLSADILIAPHHGSKSSSSQAFIQHVNPSDVFFSAGFLNQWRMPNQQVVSRYQKLGVNVYSTNELGMLKVKISDNQWQVTSFRQEISPYWFNQ